ncbi:MAG: F0F1 ATP synthase subunit B [Kiritimatiellia bacterium]
MADETNLTATVEVPSHGQVGRDAVAPTSAIDVSNRMVLLTWIAFLLAAVLLHRLAWRPILRALDKRERDIRTALDEAEQAHRQANNSAAESRKIVAEAMDRARALSEETRLATERSAARIEKEAHEKARRLVEDANQEIAAAQHRAIEDLRKEAAALSILLSERMLNEQMTPEQRRAYEQRMAGKLPS